MAGLRWLMRRSAASAAHLRRWRYFQSALQLRLSFNRDSVLPLLSGLAWKLGLAPLLIFSVGAALGVQHTILGISLLQAAMAP